MSLNVAGADGAGPFAQQVTIRDILVVSLGDSAASGEGNPDVARSGDLQRVWDSVQMDDRRAHDLVASQTARQAKVLATGISRTRSHDAGGRS